LFPKKPKIVIDVIILKMYNQENNQKITNPIYFPMIVPLVFGRVDSVDVIKKRWDVFNSLPESEKDRMLGKHVPFVIKAIAESRGFSDEEIVGLAGLVRDLFFRVVSRDNITDELQRRISKLDSGIAKEIGNKILFEILTSNTKQKSVEPPTSFLKMSINRALQQYPNIGEQLISTNQLKLRIMPTPVRPSIKNWITDFHEQMGLGKHSTLDRGNYIFHSENAKRLTPEERRRLSVVFKSLEEGDELIIDPDKQEIKFENTQESEQPMESSQAATSWKTESYQPPSMNDRTRPEQARAVLPNQQQNNFSNQTPFTIKKQAQSSEQARPMSRAEEISPIRASQGQGVNPNQQPVRRDVPQNLPTGNEEKMKSYFDRDVSRQNFTAPNQVQEMAGKEFENKSPNFSQLLKSQQNDEPSRQQPNNNTNTNSSGGTVSFSSPQQLPVERKVVIPGRSPYRISPHDED
jgi:hypothetical protein